MSGPTPNPAHDDNGVPLCNQAGCGLFDGKRCKAVGFRPDRFCEPALVDLVAENKALKARGAGLAAAAAEYPPGLRKQEAVLSSSRVLPGNLAVTLDAPPPEDLLDRITPGSLCRHTRRSLRPDTHGNPVTTCIDCWFVFP